MYLRKLGHTIDVERFLPYLKDVEWDSHGRCTINKPTGNKLYDPYELCDQWRGTEFENLISELPVVVGEIRLMKLEPGDVYRSHADIDDRIHLNLQSNEQCYLIDLDNQNMYPVTKDNELYIMDGSYLHTAVNFGSTPRIQLVMRIPLVKYNDSNFESVILEFINPPHNLRYIVDQQISPWLNRYVKYKMIGYFNELSPTKYHFNLLPKALDFIIDILVRLDIEYNVIR
jgi:hypothetical protein